jgi:large subunit ribosomal protein L25
MKKPLEAKPFHAQTKGEIKQLRASGQVTVTVQHRAQKSVHLQVEAKPLEDFILHHGQAGTLEMVIAPNNEKHTVQVRDVQRHPVTGKLMNVTFQDVHKGDEIKANVPLQFQGQPEAVRLGEAVLIHVLEQIEVRCKPQVMPEKIVVDVENLGLGELMTVADLPPHPEYHILTAPDTLLASLSALTTVASGDDAATEEIASRAEVVRETQNEPVD